jgi:hypothetical protein
MDTVSILLVFSLLFSGCSTTGFPFLGSTEEKVNPKKIEELRDTEPLKTKHPSFVDRAAFYGLHEITAMNFSLIDFDQDGFEDLVILKNYNSVPKFYRFNPINQKFELHDYLFNSQIRASYVLFYDFNQDKIKDAVVGFFNQKTELTPTPIKFFKGSLNKKNIIHFSEIKNAIKFAPGPHASIVPVDINLDGYLDLFVANWLEAGKNPQPKPDIILMNNKKNQFIANEELLEDEWKKAQNSTSYLEAKPSYTASICDVDLNGFPDILVGATHQFSNKMWLNLYDLKNNKRTLKNFAQISGVDQDQEGSLILQGGGRTFSLECADYNQDGIVDIFSGELTHVYDGDNVDKSSILTGASQSFPPKFIRTEYLRDAFDPNWSQSDKRAIWFDYNSDGLLDILVDNSGFPPHTRLILFEQLSEHDFEDRRDIGINFMNPLSSVILDINNDRQWDILSAQINTRDERIEEKIFLLQNILKFNDRKIMEIHLDTDKSNSDAIGAMIEYKIKFQDKYIYRRHWHHQSFGALPPQISKKIFLVLKENETLESIKVRWPYVNALNVSRNSMEKNYKININTKDKTQELTICENGKWFKEKTACPKPKF